jgi:transcriptional regulator with XRE-family HTH domain
MKRRLIAMRKAAGLTQEQMPELLGTKKSNISRLESLNSAISPRIATVGDYDRVVGYNMRVEFDPRAGA